MAFLTTLLLLLAFGAAAADGPPSPAPPGTADGSCDESQKSKPCGPGGQIPSPSADAVAACGGKQPGDACSFNTTEGTVTGTCNFVGDQIACEKTGS